MWLLDLVRTLQVERFDSEVTASIDIQQDGRVHSKESRTIISFSFEGVCVNYRHPDPRRGEPRVGSAPDVAFPAESSGSGGSGAELREAQKCLILQYFWHFFPELGTHFWL